MKQNQPKNLKTCFWSTGVIFLFALVFFLLYWQSGVLLFLLTAFFALMPGLVDLILLLFRFNPEKPSPKEENETSLPVPAEDVSDTPLAEENSGGKKKFRLFRKKKKTKKDSSRTSADFYEALCRIYRPVQYLLLAEALLICFVLFGYYLTKPEAASTVAYWHLAVVAVLFVASVVMEKICHHAAADSDRCGCALLRNVAIFFSLIRPVLACLALFLTLRLLNFGDICTYLVYGLAILFYYVGAMIVLSLAVRIVRKEMATAPGLVILLPFLHGDSEDLSVLSFLEENTGITFRSLWSLKYVRSLLPYAVVGGVLLFWCATGIVYVQSHQQGAVYRFGELQEEILSPGLHLTLPYPFDKTEIYDTETVNKMTIGYKSTENNDNVWTEAHGDTEYKLLLGSGNELVSINLRVEYRIRDLRQYLTFSSGPERVLEALSYHLVTDRTISADLEQILAFDRETFAKTFREELIENLAEYNTGLEVVNVILESIHPPVDVADVYQAFIGAEIDAEEMIISAQAASAVRIAEAETTAYETLSDARVDYLAKMATAMTEVSEFMAAVEASEEYPSEYSYYRYLNAICSAYQNSKLIILGNGVDSSRLYYGNFVLE